MLQKAQRNRSNWSGRSGSDGNRLLILTLLAVIIGIAAGFAAYLLLTLVGLISNLVFFQRVAFHIPELQDHTLGPFVLIVPAIGGLIVGLMAKYGSPKIRGHGTSETMEAVLVNHSRIDPRVAVLKPVATAIAIGTGGPFGAEGPIIQTGGALGSIVGQIFYVTSAERKVLLSCGAAAGMAAAFSTPIAAVILAIELFLFEFKTRSFIPLVVASVLATTVRFQLIGQSPLFEVGQMEFGMPGNIPFYVLLGLACGVFAAFFSWSLYRVEDLFERLPVDPMWWPAIGGLVIGVIGFFVPRVLGVGYENITGTLNNQLAVGVLLSILVFKSLALFVALGSGTSGSLLVAMFMVSAALGALFAMAINAVLPGANLSPGAFALVAMAAVFGAASRATFTFIIFAFELTRDYTAVLPLMLGCVIADLIAMRLMRNSIMTEKLARHGLHIEQDYEADIMQQVAVAEVMDPDPPYLSASMPLAQLAALITSDDPSINRRNGLPILDDDGRLAGIVTRGDVLRALERPDRDTLTVLDAGTPDPLVAYPDEPMHNAIDRMLENNIGRLPVVRRDRPWEMVGYLGRTGILEARLKRLRDENVREPGWLHQALDR